MFVTNSLLINYGLLSQAKQKAQEFMFHAIMITPIVLWQISKILVNVPNSFLNKMFVKKKKSSQIRIKILSNVFLFSTVKVWLKLEEKLYM